MDNESVFDSTLNQSDKILIRDEKNIYNEVINPAIVYDIESGLIKIGEQEAMQEYFNMATKKFRDSGANWMAEQLRLMVLPKY